LPLYKSDEHVRGSSLHLILSMRVQKAAP
jgi:hypothetical protein